MGNEQLNQIAVLNRELCDRFGALRLGDYPSDTPAEVAATLQRLCEAFADVFREYDQDFEDSDKVHFARHLLHVVVPWLSQFHSHLENSGWARVPWSIVEPLEALAKKSVGVRVILSTGGIYNYSIDIGWLHRLSETLEEISRRWTRSETFKEACKGVKGLSEIRILIIPFIERMNVLQHALLGHELGHLIATQFWEEVIARDKEKQDQGKTTTSGELLLQCSSIYPATAMEYVAALVKELVSDMAAVYLFGFAGLFALDSLASILPAPSPSSYPPWALRRRFALHVFDRYLDLEPFLQQMERTRSELAGIVRQRLEDIRNRSADTRADLDTAPREYRVACQWLADKKQRTEAGEFVHRKLGASRYDLTGLGRVLGELMTRLENKIPPNEDDNYKPVEFRDILSAAWVYYLKDLAQADLAAVDADEGFYRDMRVFRRLSVKAGELAQIHREWREEEEEA
jgi:hypothetical protein